ncbi:hypothetical protein LINGRAHAP2_LOCUS29630 [Linum grandiflorum]
MDSQKSTSFQAGEVKGQTQEKASSMMDKAGNAAQSVKESAQDNVWQAGSQMQTKAHGAAEATKDKLGMNN